MIHGSMKLRRRRSRNKQSTESTKPKLMAKGGIQLEDLIRRFPNGFVISPKLGIYEIVGQAVNEISNLPEKDPKAEPRIRGYIAVSLPRVRPGIVTGKQVF